MNQSPLETVKRGYEYLNAKDINGYLQILSPQVEFYQTDGYAAKIIVCLHYFLILLLCRKRMLLGNHLFKFELAHRSG